MSVAKNIISKQLSQPAKQVKSPKSFTRAQSFSKILLAKLSDSENLSAHAFRVLMYILNRSDDWVIRPTFIQKRFGFGNYTWRKVTRELRKEGFLRLKVGGKVCGGSAWELVIPGAEGAVDHQPLAISMEKGERLIVNHHTNNTSTKEQYNRKTTTETTMIKESSTMKTLDEKVVVTLVKKMKDEVGLTEKDAQLLLDIHGSDQIIEKLEILKAAMLKPSKPNNPIGWFKTSLRNNFKLNNQKPLKIVSTANNTQRNHKLEASALQQMEARVSEYEANQTEEQKRIHEYYAKRFASRKRDSHSASK